MNYEWLEARQHVLKRPDTYIGPINIRDIKGYTIDEEKKEICDIQCCTSPAIFKMFDEIITNAIDNSKRSDEQKFIKVNVNKDTGVFEISNDGKTIPIQHWENTNRYIPEILFMELMSGENFKDERAQVGGRNGLGAKIVNLLSTWFLIEIVNTDDEKRYKQMFRNNSFDFKPPEINKLLKKDKYSSLTISWLPDYKRLGIQLPLNDNIVNMIRTRVYDAAACTNPKVTVYFGNSKINIKSISIFF